MTPQEKKKQTELENIMNKHDVTYEEAQYIRIEKYRNYGRKGGKTSGFSKVRGDSDHYSKIGKKGANKRYGNA